MTGIVKVTRGESSMNRISFDTDTSSFPYGDYNVTMNGVIQSDARDTRQFTVCCGPPGATPSPAVPVANPTRSPGYSAMMALIGLGAVAFCIVGRH
jgi:hypothetical protein